MRKVLTLMVLGRFSSLSHSGMWRVYPGALRCQYGDLVIQSMEIKKGQNGQGGLLLKQTADSDEVGVDGLLGHRIRISLDVDMAEEHRYSGARRDAAIPCYKIIVRKS